MHNLQSKILKVLKNNKLNPTNTGKRKWYDYFISVDEFVWARNFIDGYLIHIYSDKYKSEHLAAYTLTFAVFKNERKLAVNYEKIK